MNETSIDWENAVITIEVDGHQYHYAHLTGEIAQSLIQVLEEDGIDYSIKHFTSVKE